MPPSPLAKLNVTVPGATLLLNSEMKSRRSYEPLPMLTGASLTRRRATSLSTPEPVPPLITTLLGRLTTVSMPARAEPAPSDSPTRLTTGSPFTPAPKICWMGYCARSRVVVPPPVVARPVSPAFTTGCARAGPATISARAATANSVLFKLIRHSPFFDREPAEFASLTKLLTIE